MVNEYDPIEDSESETTTTSYGHIVNGTDSKTYGKTTTNNLTQTNNLTTTNNLTQTHTGTDNTSISNTDQTSKVPYGGQSAYYDIDRHAINGSNNETLNLSDSNTGTVENTGTVANTGTITDSGTDSGSNSVTESGSDVITREKIWTNNNLYNELIENRFKYNTEFSLIEYYLNGFKNLVMYIDNDVWG